MALLSPLSSDYLFMKHTPPSAPSYCKSPKRNTVHWELREDPSVKENAAPETKTSTFAIQEPKSPQAYKQFHQSRDSRLDLFGDKKLRGQQRRAPLAAETFIAPEPLSKSKSTRARTDKDPFGDHDLVKAARHLDPNENVFDKHKKKQFQWVLSLPASVVSSSDHSLERISESAARRNPGEGDRRYFGCNLLTWTKPSGKEDQLPGDAEDKYLLLATPIDLKPDHTTTAEIDFTTHEFRILQEETHNIDMAAAQVTNMSSSAAKATYRPSPLSATSAKWSMAVEPSEDGDHTLTVDLNPEPHTPISNIEDSLREVENLEEAIRAMNIANGLGEFDHGHEGNNPNPGAQSGTAPSPAQRSQGASAAKANVSSRRSPLRELSSVLGSDKEVSRTPPAGTLRKVARPASLAPPRPLQKTGKVPTVSTFELTGARVARELKEKKAARLSMQVDYPTKPAEVVSPQRTRSIRSSKPPTVPNFELPGERYSRQKKERLEQKLKEEEEEARRRRQFKARPSPANAAPTVRSTFTSRQRQTTDGPCSPAGESSPKAGISKRQSVTMTASAVRTASIASTSTVSTAARGRTSSYGSSHLSTRATSSSAGSVASASKRNTLTSGEMEQQKARGRQIYGRDNTMGRTKAREEQDRKEAIKLARQKYAEMSRNKAAQGRARRSMQLSNSSAEGSAYAGTNNLEGVPPRVPEHVHGVGRK